MMHGIIEILRLNASVQNAVGANAEGTKYKIYPVITPQKEKPPYIVCALTGSEPVQGKNCRSTLDKENFDCLIYADTYEQGHNIDLAIRVALDQASGSTDETGIHFDSIWFVSRRDAAIEGKEGMIYVRVASYSCQVKANP